MAKISDEIKNQIPILYKKLGTITAVSKELDISVSTVRKYLDDDLIAEVKNKKKVVKAELSKKKNEVEEKEICLKTSLTPDEAAAANDYFEFTLSYAETADKFQTTPAIIRKYLTQENIEAASKQLADKDLLAKYVRKLFNEQETSKWNYIQMEKFRKKGINYKAQLLTLTYWYEVLGNGTEKAHKSIGIIPYVVEDARNYYLKKIRERRIKEEKLKIQVNNEHEFINYTPSKNNVREIDLNNIGDIDD